VENFLKRSHSVNYSINRNWEDGEIPMTTDLHRGSLLVKEATWIVPEAVMKIQVEKNKGGCGAIIHNGTELQSVPADHLTLDKWMTLQESLKDQKAIFYLSNITNVIPEEDKQPIVLLSNDAGDPLIIGVLEGEFPSSNDSSAHTPEYRAAQKLMLRFKKEYKLFEGDMTKMWENIKDPSTHDEIVSGLIGHRGAIGLFLSTGNAITFDKDNSLGGDFRWGYASNAFGYTEQNEAMTDGTRTTPRNLEAKNKLAALLGKDPSDTKIPDKAGIEEEFELIEPPVNIQGKNSIRNWYEKLMREGRISAVPANFKDRPKVRAKKVVEKVTAKSFDEAARILQDKKPVGPSSPLPNVTFAEKQQAVLDKDPTAIIPTIDAVQRTDFLDVFMKTIDVNNLEIMDVQQVADFETNWPTLSQQMGIPEELANGLRMSFEKKCDLADAYPKIAAVGWQNLVSHHIRLLAAYTKATADLKAAEELLGKPADKATTSVPLIGKQRFGIR